MKKERKILQVSHKVHYSLTVVQRVDLPTQVLPSSKAASKDLTSEVDQTQSLSPEAKGAGLKVVVTIASALHPALAPLGNMINAAVDQKAAARRAAAAAAPPAQALPPALPLRAPPSQNPLADQSRSLLQSEPRPSPNPEYQQVETTGSVNISLSTELHQALYTTAIQSLIQSGTAEPKVPALSMNSTQELLQVLPPVQTEAQRRQALTLQPLSRSISNSLPPLNEPSGTSAPQLSQLQQSLHPAEQLLTALPAAMPAIAHYGATHHDGHHAHHALHVTAPQSHHHLFNHTHNQHKAAQPAASASGLEPDPNDPAVQARFQQALALQNQKFAMTRSIMAGQNTQFAAVGQMNMENFNTMNQINAGYAAQAQDQLQDRMQTRAVNDANKYLYAQAFSANTQGDDWALFSAGQTNVKFS
jgi:hypothetical protein